MSLGRSILAVLFLLAAAGCAGTGVHDETPSGTAAVSPVPAKPSARPASGRQPVFTPVARKRPTPPPEPRPAATAPSASAPVTSSAADGAARPASAETAAKPNPAFGANGRNDANGPVEPPVNGVGDAATPVSGEKGDETARVAALETAGQGGREGPGNAAATTDADGGPMESASTKPTGPASPEISPASATALPTARDPAIGANGLNEESDPVESREREIGIVAAMELAAQSDEPGQAAMPEQGDPGNSEGAGVGDEPAGLAKVLQRPSFEERSLKCDVVELMGKAIGRRRIRGEDRKPATDSAIDDVLIQTGGVRDNRFVFSGRVYGMLIYRLTPDHTASGFGAYAHAACLILRGGKGIVPADEISEMQLDQMLKICESSAPAPDDLNACILDRMEEIVRQRGPWSG